MNPMPTFVEPSSPRSIVSEDLEGLRICIPSKFSWIILFMLFWLTFWTIGGVSAARSMQRHFNLFLCFWLVGWAFGELAVSYSVLYLIGGREVILVNSESLTKRTEIFGIGPAKSYRVGEMRNLRFQPTSGVGKGRIPNRIAFDYGAKTVTFGAGIDEPEANDLISRIRQRCGIVEASAPQGSGTKFWQPR
jgi:hypothetical protein